MLSYGNERFTVQIHFRHVLRAVRGETSVGMLTVSVLAPSRGAGGRIEH